MAEDPEYGPSYRGSEIHRYWAFSTGTQVYYYNVKTGDRRTTPPDIGARATTLVQKRVRGFLARLRGKIEGKRRAAGAGGMFVAQPSHWDLTTLREEAEAKAEAAAGSGSGSGSDMLRSETDKWEREKAQREVKDKLEAVLAKYKESIEFGGDGRWTMSEFSTVLTLLKRAHSTGLADPRVRGVGRGGWWLGWWIGVVLLAIAVCCVCCLPACCCF